MSKNIVLSSSLGMLVSLAKLQAVVSRRFDASLNGISFNEFIILYNLSLAPEEKLRRGELAERIGLTASGVTRLLLPMEKIGLVSRLTDERDGRVSFVALARGGKTKLEEGLERAEILVEDLVPESKMKRMSELGGLVDDLSGLVK